MAKIKVFEITKNFGEKTLEKVFVKDENQQCTEISLQEKIAYALGDSETVCLVAETALTDELIRLLVETRHKTGLRIYVIVPKLKDVVLSQFKNNAIVREIPDICGNYLICDTSVAFFFNRELKGYVFENTESVGKLHDSFVFNFWNNAKQEFVVDINPVAERSFDVAPVDGNDFVVIDRSALEPHPYEELINKACGFACQKNVSDFIKNDVEKSVLYLDKQGCEAAKDWLLKTRGKHIICTDSSVVPLCRNGSDWYVLNSSFDKTADNTGKLFAVKMESEPVFKNKHTLKDSFTYHEAVGKSMFYAKDFSPIKIAESDSEVRDISYDYRNFKKIAKMADIKREVFFDEKHLLLSDKLAVKVNFTITMTVKQLSKGADLAPIYAEYEQFSKKQADALGCIRDDIKKSKDNVDICTAELQNIEKYERIVKELRETEERRGLLSKKMEESKKAKTELEAFEKEVQKKQRQLDEVEKEIHKLLDKKKDVSAVQKKQSDLKKEIGEIENKIEKLRSISASYSSLEEKQSELEKFLEEHRKKINDLKKYSRDGENFAKQKIEKERILKEKKERLIERESLLYRAEKLSKNAETVNECKTISDVLAEYKLPIPTFDKPKYGKLYKVGSSYEYMLDSDENSDEAESEMTKAGIANVEFVTNS